MKISAHQRVGKYSNRIKIEYDSSVAHDRLEVDKYISRVIGPIGLEPKEDDVE